MLMQLGFEKWHGRLLTNAGGKTVLACVSAATLDLALRCLYPNPTSPSANLLQLRFLLAANTGAYRPTCGTFGCPRTAPRWWWSGRKTDRSTSLPWWTCSRYAGHL